MVDATMRFFEDLDRRGFEPLLAKTAGTLRFDLHEGAHTTHWLLEIDRGKLQVRQEDREADTVVGTGPRLFDELVCGKENGIAALLRGDMTVAGDLRLVLQVERLFPGPPDSRGPHHAFRREGL
ncbi:MULTISPECIES: SCP2 sterol-binding domain-containing protein [Micromonospora]|uniref:Sterol-binding protein n=1 Tax=Micromonospora solifontis TaxID=2487138 RepID=A0ABX9WDU3_9ACTN|nr:MULTISPECIES: SCP2 sterol-binding domain-containing protein [Micromonospora]NES16812.1 SCP2 sterol-binding domain-containing protein [Micromonospora sp. PPF5-17B]NES37830.1 SCP2 sterol-binding domain-containing protein [Micromonospora solifontis]NES58550.1 SCP2 sterol-binding domain-containing protein [Micromonospora sp. PPF5-6]RNL97927.1 sterol-binding protein [Micromonospora solifontis]